MEVRPIFPLSDVKLCHSQYYHPSKKHSATAKIDGKSAKVTKGKGIWAKASKDGAAGTCYAYWASMINKCFLALAPHLCDSDVIFGGMWGWARARGGGGAAGCRDA
ncbi:lactococcin 972 family bacteriocin [Streptomyces chrestomyceticus]|uniref:lactococcin 972 family bacteriocin n=1 Tax=Streptomyces chrestomyceticus TaxID=68185 RepID=UPI0033F5C82A